MTDTPATSFDAPDEPLEVVLAAYDAGQHGITAPPVDGVGAARERARQLLADDHPRSWARTTSVVAACIDLAGRARLTGVETSLLVAAAWSLEIGVTNTAGHNVLALDSADLIAGQLFEASLVAWRSATPEEAGLLELTHVLERHPQPDGLLPDLLTYADMTTSHVGEPCTFEQRLVDLRARRGPHATSVHALETAWARLGDVRDRVTAAISS